MEEKILRNHIDDQVNIALKKGIGKTKFITLTEQIEVQSHINQHKYNQQVDIIYDGGYSGAERVRIIFVNKGWGKYIRDEYLTALVISHRKEDTIGHRDILGALMNIGIERNTIGDIETKGKKPTLVCLPEVGAFIQGSLTKIGNVGVGVQTIDLEKLGERIEELEMIQLISSSMRIDCLVSEVFNLSRKVVSNLIKQGKISYNHKLVTKQDSLATEGDIITLRGKGKFKIESLDGKTKKDRIKLVIGKFV